MNKKTRLKKLVLLFILSFGMHSLYGNSNVTTPKIKDQYVSFLINPIPVVSIGFQGFGLGQTIEYKYKSLSFSLSIDILSVPSFETYCSGKVVLFSSELGFRWYCFKKSVSGLFLGIQSGIKLLSMDGDSFLSEKNVLMLYPTTSLTVGWRFNFTPRKKVHFVLDVGLSGEFFFLGTMHLSGAYEYQGPLDRYYFALFPLLKSGIAF